MHIFNRSCVLGCQAHIISAAKLQRRLSLVHTFLAMTHTLTKSTLGNKNHISEFTRDHSKHNKIQNQRQNWTKWRLQMFDNPQ